MSVTNQRSEHDEGHRIGAEPDRQEAQREGADERDDGCPPVDPPPRRVLFVVLGPARRESVGGDTEHEARRSEDARERIHRLASRRFRSGVPRVPRLAGGQPAAAPARASSTRVAWATPVAPFGANGSVFRK